VRNAPARGKGTCTASTNSPACRSSLVSR
jgi:hypothetical protein